MGWFALIFLTAIFSAAIGGAAGLAMVEVHDPGRVDCANLKIQVERVKQALENTK